MDDTPFWTLDTRLIHGQGEPHLEDGDLVPPVSFSSAFEHPTAERLEEIFAGKQTGYLYSRLQNPTVDRLEKRITAACGGRGALAMASGMSAITLGLLGLLKAGDEIITGRHLFGGTFTLLDKTLPPLGITTRFVEAQTPAQAETVAGPATRLVLLEAIANPALTVPDFAAWRKFCDERGLPLLVDATFLTPVLLDNQIVQADVVFFSTTKFFSGAATTLGGIVVDMGRMNWETRKDPGLADFRKAKEGAYLAKLRRRLMMDIGPALSPMSAFLQLIGMETLPLRLERQCANALAAARHLAAHPKVKSVVYPGLPGHPSHALAAQQFQGRFGSMLAFTLPDKAACFRFLNALKLARRSTNLGDTKTLALHPASTIYGGYWPHELEQVGVSEGMIRFSLGIESPQDILADLDQALEHV
ncbi:MAG: PLP-dependent transferase [Deltaproteobacteria bacterium]|nr:PLP-dependent transferase [Deltaproteobacteria bacterium]